MQTPLKTKWQLAIHMERPLNWTLSLTRHFAYTYVYLRICAGYIGKVCTKYVSLPMIYTPISSVGFEWDWEKSNDVFEGPLGATNALIRSSKRNLLTTKETEVLGALEYFFCFLG